MMISRAIEIYKWDHSYKSMYVLDKNKKLTIQNNLQIVFVKFYFEFIKLQNNYFNNKYFLFYLCDDYLIFTVSLDNLC